MIFRAKYKPVFLGKQAHLRNTCKKRTINIHSMIYQIFLSAWCFVLIHSKNSYKYAKSQFKAQLPVSH